jgi:hypothetical protein
VTKYESDDIPPPIDEDDVLEAAHNTPDEPRYKGCVAA